MGDVIELAMNVHAGQIRKITEVPYWTHLEAVANYIAGAGGSKDQIAAGWLHDTIEDTEVTYYDILDQFDQNVADLVWSCTDTPGLSGNPRRTAKLKYLNEMHPDDPARLVMQADVLHNFASNVTAYSLYGLPAFKNFGKQEGIIKYYGEKMVVLSDGHWTVLSDQFLSLSEYLESIMPVVTIEKINSAHVFDEYK